MGVLQEERRSARGSILTNAQQAPHFRNWAHDDMGRATATNYIIAHAGTKSNGWGQAMPFSKVCEGPKMAEAATDAGGQRMLGQANCGGVLVEFKISIPLYICRSELVLNQGASYSHHLITY